MRYGEFPLILLQAKAVRELQKQSKYWKNQKVSINSPSGEGGELLYEEERWLVLHS